MATLTDFATTEQARYEGRQSRAGSSLAASQAGLTQAQASLDAAANDLKTNEDAATAIRKQLEAAPMPADAKKLADDLEATLVTMSTVRIRANAAQHAIDLAQIGVERAQAELDAATAAVTSATAALADAQKSDTDHSAWHALTTGAPLATISTAAVQALAGTTFQQASTRAARGFHATLLTRVRGRAQVEQSRLAAARTAMRDAEDALDGKLAHDAVPSGTVAQKRRAYLRAEADFRDAVQRSPERLARALALLETVKAAAPPTAAELALIQSREADALTAAPLEAAVDTAQTAVEAAQAALDKAKVAVRATNPDASDADVAADQDVQHKQTDLNTANGTLTTAKAAFLPANKTALDSWEAAIPEASWTLLQAFDEASAILAQLRDHVRPADLTALETAMTTAATALAAALDTESKSVRAIADLQNAVALTARLFDTATQSARGRVLAAMRGDR